MIDTDLIKHGGEFARYLANNKFEMTEHGIEFPVAQAEVFGEYQDKYGTEKNLLTIQGLNHLLMVALSNSSKLNDFYLALYSGNFTPTGALTAAQFAASAGEIVSASEGYSNATRPQWNPAAADSGAIDNYANKAEFNIATTGSVTIRGAALLSDWTKGSTSGVLISASRFSHERVEYDGNVYQLGYRVRLQSS